MVRYWYRHNQRDLHSWKYSKLTWTKSEKHYPTGFVWRQNQVTSRGPLQFKILYNSVLFFSPKAPVLIGGVLFHFHLCFILHKSLNYW